ncbi:hypothetical protein STEG23_011969, partial [Scotinomys teguina]
KHLSYFSHYWDKIPDQTAAYGRLNHILYLAGMYRMGGEPVLKTPIAEVP